MSRNLDHAEIALASLDIDTDAKVLVRQLLVAIFLDLPEPGYSDASTDEALGGFVHGAEMQARAAAARHHVQELEEFVALVVVFGVLELGVCEQRVEDAQVGVAQSGGGEGQVEQVADHDVHQDAEVVGVEVFVGGLGGEEEVEEFENQELERGLAFAVEEEDDVFAKGLEDGAVG